MNADLKYLFFLVGAQIPLFANADCTKSDSDWLWKQGYSGHEIVAMCTDNRADTTTFKPPVMQAAANAPAPQVPVVIVNSSPISNSRYMSDSILPPKSTPGIIPAATSGDKPAPSPDTGSTNFFQNWAMGLALLRNQTSIVNDATIVNGVVRGNTVQRYQPELVLSKHYYFHNADGTCTITSSAGYCLGIFLGAGVGGQSSSSPIIDMLGAGLLIGSLTNSKSGESVNFGIGFARRFGVKTLGNGIKLDAPLPAGETQIRYTNVDMSAPMVFYTYKF